MNLKSIARVDSRYHPFAAWDFRGRSKSRVCGLQCVSQQGLQVLSIDQPFQVGLDLREQVWVVLEPEVQRFHRRAWPRRGETVLQNGTHVDRFYFRRLNRGHTQVLIEQVCGRVAEAVEIRDWKFCLLSSIMQIGKNSVWERGRLLLQ